MQQIVADNLAAEIARRRLTGRKLAIALGLGQMYVARRVSGQTALDVNDLALFSDYLGIDPSVLLKAESPHQSPDGGHESRLRDLNPGPVLYKGTPSPIIDMFQWRASA